MPEIAPFLEYAMAFFLVVSGVFGFVGSYGLLKLDDLMARLHAPTKSTTLGVGGVLMASIIHSAFAEDHLSLHEALITLFLFLTAPVTAHFIAKAHMHRYLRPEDLPDCAEDTCWAVYDEEKTPES